MKNQKLKIKKNTKRITFRDVQKKEVIFTLHKK